MIALRIGHPKMLSDHVLVELAVKLADRCVEKRRCHVLDARERDNHVILTPQSCGDQIVDRTAVRGGNGMRASKRGKQADGYAHLMDQKIAAGSTSPASWYILLSAVLISMSTTVPGNGAASLAFPTFVARTHQ